MTHGTTGNIGAGMMILGAAIYIVDQIINAYHVWQFNRTAGPHDPRKVDHYWNWRKP